jgi:ribosomal protein S18 acetylase RimI-like enzyme
MTNNPSQGMIKKQILSPADINEVERLAQICNDFEHLDMRIDWIEIRPEYFGNMHDYLYYEHGQLIGYLFLKRFGTSQKEITGMVHPDYRRRGIFSRMFAAASEECRAKGVRHVLLICERDSASGQALVATLGACLDFSEHKMVLETFHERFAFDDRLSFQRAYMDDLDALITIISDGWGRSAEDVRESVSFNLGEPHCQVYIARFGGNELSCGEPVGCLRVYDMGNEMGIYGFVVRPAYRGLGYGRQMLEEVILDIRSSVNSSKSIMLEVDTDNSVALNLYRSIGMEIKRTYEYYDIGANI